MVSGRLAQKMGEARTAKGGGVVDKFHGNVTQPAAVSLPAVNPTEDITSRSSYNE